MDPYIDCDALDRRHPLTARKLDNLARADAAMRVHADVVDALPSKVTFQTTDVCNLSCPHCQIPPAAKRASMHPKLLETLRETLLPDLIELHPTNLGEPFAWPHFGALCRELEEHGVVLDLTTNGTRLTDEHIEWIAPIARDIKISFDGATRATFERFRRGADFDRVCGNVARLTERLRRVSVRRPLVSLQMTLMRDNVDELPELVRLAKRLGADRVKGYHLFVFSPEMDEQSLLRDPTHYDNRVRPQVEEVAGSLGIALEIAEPGGGAPNSLVRRTCHLPWHETWVDVDGSVLVCHSHEGRIAGELARFSEAWNGPLYREIRSGFAAGKLVGACNGCGMTWERASRGSAVPYDRESFQSAGAPTETAVRWSGRMRQFDLKGRRPDHE